MNKYKITTQEELDKLNYTENPEAKYIKWAGCNYYKNSGNNEHEPLGTAQSMHDCMGCERFNICNIKMDTPTWFWNEDIEKELNLKWKSMFN